MRESILDIVGRLLNMAPYNINNTQPLMSLGLDSMLVELLAKELSKHFECHVSTASVYGHPTIAKLEDYVYSLIFESELSQTAPRIDLTCDEKGLTPPLLLYTLLPL